MEFRELLRDIRVKNGDSYRGLAYKMEILFTYIQKVEKGTSPPSNLFLEKLIQVYPLYKNELIMAFCKEKLPDVAFDYMQKDFTYLDTLFNILEDLDSEEQQKILNNFVDELELSLYRSNKIDKSQDILKEIRKEIKKL